MVENDALNKGAERLAANILPEEDCGGSWGGSSVDPDDIATDPGVKALVEYVQRQIDCGGALVMEDARAALKLWEHGS